MIIINGKAEDGEGAEFSSRDPGTDEVLWTGAEASEFQVKRAVEAARGALSTWSSQSFDNRVKVLERFVSLLEPRKDEFAELISSEMGKALWDAKGEVGAMVGKVKASLDAFSERCPERTFSFGDYNSVTRFKPHGVVGIFGPFNFPGHLPNGHIIPALIAGNTIVFKPSEQTPVVGQRLVELWTEAGLPPGVLNLVQGSKIPGVALAGARGIDGLFFTGSSSVGVQIHKSFAGSPEKILALEMGGNNPLVVWDVADLKAAAYATVQSAFITSGQRCTCARRLIIDAKSSPPFLDELLQLSNGIVAGHYRSDPEPFLGPVIDLKSGVALQEAFRDLEKRGATVLKELKKIGARDNLLSPGIVDVTALENRADGEHFGPILQVIQVNSFEAAISEANNTDFGLSAGLLSDSKANYEKFFQDIRAGIVNWNRQTTGASSKAPFGGIGLSGNHRPAAWFAADYCAYPVASIESEELSLPERLSPGLKV